MEVGLRKALLWCLSILLLLSLARQVFDFLGYLWLPIIVNFVHLVAVIFGLFGAVQFRSSFLILFCGWDLIWLAWNTFLVCFYLSLGALDRDQKFLGFGTRGSRSFWVQNTPFCKNSFDYASGSWSAEDCYLSWHFVETTVALVHIAAASAAFVLAVAFLLTFARKWREEKAAPKVRVEFTQPHGTTAFSAVSMHPASAKSNPGYVDDSAYDASSGYLNTSYEPTSPSPLEHQPPFAQPHSQSNSRRSSKKKKKKRQEELEAAARLDGTTSEALYNEFSHPPPLSQYSVATTMEMADGRRRVRATSSTRESREAKAARRRDRTARSVSPPSRRSHLADSRITLDSHISQEAPRPQLPMLPPPASHYRQRSNSAGKRRPYRHYAGVSQEQAARLGGSQPSMLGNSVASKDDPEGDILAYHNEPRRLSVTEPRGIRNSTDSALNAPANARQRHKGPPPKAPVPLTSLVSFDPKSNTLIRYHEHLARSREQSSRDESADSPPPQMAPTLPHAFQPPPSYAHHYQKRSGPAALANAHNGFTNGGGIISDRTSYDSGIPSSLGNGGGSEESSTSSQPSSRSQEHAPKSILTNPRHNYYEPPSSHLQPPHVNGGFTEQSGPYITTNPAFRGRVTPTSHAQPFHAHSRSNSGFSQPPPPPLAPVRAGVVMAVDEDVGDCSFDSSFSMPPPPPPPPAQKTPAPFFLPPLSAQMSRNLQRSSDDLSAQGHYAAAFPRRPQPPPIQPLIHDNSLLV